VIAPLASERFPPEASGILIKAQPARDQRSCRFMLNREVLPGYSWRFDNRSRAQGSPVASALLELREVRAVNVHGSTVTIEIEERLDDWRPLATAIGTILRAQLEAASPPIAPEIVSGMPSESSLRETVQRAIDEEINPGIAGHGGVVSLIDVQGNTLYLRMGGGCQGCIAAEDTLKFGIDDALRRWEPRIGLILDATDHSAGQNPYYRTRE
jgi:Fe-S cluster biogenesis protein NfuA